ncbi:MAG: hypothetical protein P8M78_13165 [Myxococcota bacterium]|nr:hypothetical protein [Myxococcota bacterium]
MRAVIFLVWSFFFAVLIGCGDTAETPFVNAFNDSYDVFFDQVYRGATTRDCIEWTGATAPGTCNCPDGGQIVTSFDGTVPGVRISGLQNCQVGSQTFNGTIRQDGQEFSGYSYQFDNFAECDFYSGNSPIGCIGEFEVRCAGFPDNCGYEGYDDDNCFYGCSGPE